MFPHLRLVVWAIDQKSCAFDGSVQNIVLAEERKLVHGDEVRVLNEISTLDWTRTKTQVRDSHRTGFLGVVYKITLGVVWSLFTDNLDRVLIGTDCSIGAKAPKDCSHLILGLSTECLVKWKARESDIVVDPD